MSAVQTHPGDRGCRGCKGDKPTELRILDGGGLAPPSGSRPRRAIAEDALEDLLLYIEYTVPAGGSGPAVTTAPTVANAAAPSEPLDTLRAEATAGDGAAAFTLWERLRDSDFATAETWLRTASDLGDVRATYRLGMLLWERGDLDGAETALRRATADPQAAYALGRLLWRERGDADAAIEWLDRAAQADDPAAQRDLGLLLRERGDLQGAWYWLGRAAERDDEAHRALSDLDDG